MTTIDATEHVPGVSATEAGALPAEARAIPDEAQAISAETGAVPAHAARDWGPIAEWARALVGRIAAELPTQHIAVFIPAPEHDALRLAAQEFGPGEDADAVVPGEWLIPIEGSICGRVYRTGLAALSADVALDPDYRSFPGGRTRSALTIPVGPPEAVRAVVNLEAPWVAAFSIRDYELLTEHAALALPTFPERLDG